MLSTSLGGGARLCEESASSTDMVRDGISDRNRDGVDEVLWRNLLLGGKVKESRAQESSRDELNNQVETNSMIELRRGGGKPTSQSS